MYREETRVYPHPVWKGSDLGFFKHLTTASPKHPARSLQWDLATKLPLLDSLMVDPPSDPANSKHGTRAKSASSDTISWDWPGVVESTLRTVLVR